MVGLEGGRIRLIGCRGLEGRGLGCRGGKGRGLLWRPFFGAGAGGKTIAQGAGLLQTTHGSGGRGQAGQPGIRRWPRRDDGSG